MAITVSARENRLWKIRSRVLKVFGIIIVFVIILGIIIANTDETSSPAQTQEQTTTVSN